MGQAFRHIGKKATIAIRQPSMGPTFGIKGGAAGGGYSQVIPMELLNLHLTGDFHAVTAAHNLLAAILDNHLHQGNALGLDLHNITWRRVLDVNDRALRNIVIGLGSKEDGVTRQSGLRHHGRLRGDGRAGAGHLARPTCKARLARIVVGYTKDGEPVTAEDLQGSGAMAAILRDATKPNLLQTLEHTPVLVHAGPFGNIAHGNSSVLADLIGIHSGDFLVTEAGFGADMGAERFFNIKCRNSGLHPDAAVVVATVRALKAHSGHHRIVAGKALPDALLAENPDEVHIGGANLRKQIENIRIHGVSPVVAINAFPTDHPSEWRAIEEIAAEMGARAAVCQHFAEGGRGATDLAEAVAEAAEEPSALHACCTPTTPRCGRRSRRWPPRSTAPAAVDLPARRVPPARQLRAQRLRPPAGLHRQDPPVDLVGPRAQGRADRLDDAGARGPRPRWAPASSTRCAARCAPCPASAGNPAAFSIDVEDDGTIVGLS